MEPIAAQVDPVLTAAAVLVAILAGIVGTSWGWIEALSQRDDAVQARTDEAEQRRLALANADEAKGSAQKARAEAQKARGAGDEARRLAKEEKAARAAIEDLTPEVEQQREACELYLSGFHFLSQKFRRAADHHRGDEHRNDN